MQLNNLKLKKIFIYKLQTYSFALYIFQRHSRENNSKFYKHKKWTFELKTKVKSHGYEN